MSSHSDTILALIEWASAAEARAAAAEEERDEARAASAEHEAAAIEFCAAADRAEQERDEALRRCVECGHKAEAQVTLRNFASIREALEVGGMDVEYKRGALEALDEAVRDAEAWASKFWAAERVAATLADALQGLVIAAAVARADGRQEKQLDSARVIARAALKAYRAREGAAKG